MAQVLGSATRALMRGGTGITAALAHCRPLASPRSLWVVNGSAVVGGRGGGLTVFGRAANMIRQPQSGPLARSQINWSQGH